MDAGQGWGPKRSGKQRGTVGRCGCLHSMDAPLVRASERRHLNSNESSARDDSLKTEAQVFTPTFTSKDRWSRGYIHLQRLFHSCRQVAPRRASRSTRHGVASRLPRQAVSGRDRRRGKHETESRRKLEPGLTTASTDRTLSRASCLPASGCVASPSRIILANPTTLLTNSAPTACHRTARQPEELPSRRRQDGQLRH